jgi:hypothetical protein
MMPIHKVHDAVSSAADACTSARSSRRRRGLIRSKGGCAQPATLTSVKGNSSTHSGCQAEPEVSAPQSYPSMQRSDRRARNIVRSPSPTTTA